MSSPASADDYAAAREAAALVELPERGVLATTGPDRLKFLHGLLSNDLASRLPGQGRLAALMDAKGHQLAWIRALVDADAVLLEMNLDRVPVAEARLQHYRVAAPVRFETRPTAVLALLGPGVPALLTRCGHPAGELPEESHRLLTVAGSAARAVRASDLPAGGYVLHVAPETAPALRQALAALGVRAIDRATLDVLRVEDGRPWYGSDVTQENLLHETGCVREYHSPTKGCYPGQEVVARLEGRGANVNKRLRGLRLGAPAVAGDAVTASGEAVGSVTTAGVSPRLGPVAMAYLRRSHCEPGTAVEVRGAPATVVALPMQAPA